MIHSKADLREYYIADCKATGIYSYRKHIVKRLRDRRFLFYKILRKTEYYTNCRSDLPGRIYAKFLRFQYSYLCNKYMWTIPINVFGKGLQLVHVGPVVVSGDARVGAYARIHVGVNIGRAYAHGKDGAPIIGDCCYFGPGAKVFGPIKIGNHIAIGANAVVNTSFEEGNCTVGGGRQRLYPIIQVQNILAKEIPGKNPGRKWERGYAGKGFWIHKCNFTRYACL